MLNVVAVSDQMNVEIIGVFFVIGIIDNCVFIERFSAMVAAV